MQNQTPIVPKGFWPVLLQILMKLERLEMFIWVEDSAKPGIRWGLPQFLDLGQRFEWDRGI